MIAQRFFLISRSSCFSNLPLFIIVGLVMFVSKIVSSIQFKKNVIIVCLKVYNINITSTLVYYVTIDSSIEIIDLYSQRQFCINKNYKREQNNASNKDVTYDKKAGKN